ncbi:MAG: hypothetical protein JXR66_00620 [Bacteroidales bacterium]|nr:hypothetical protein [Bacteroidales bacterium]MBN2632027.1 hypothetical protein [Bacteroidales bacterium]
MKKIFFLLILATLLLGSCKKEDIPPVETGVTPEQARDTLYYVMKAFYYWYDLMPAVDRLNYSDPYDLLEAMRYRELDRWSFVADYEEFISEMGGTFVGHGIRVGLADDNTARIAQIYKNAPLYSNGVRRGWKIKSVNGYNIAQILINNDAQAYNTAFGPPEAGVTNTFVFENPEGTELTITSTKASFSVNSVILYDTICLDAEKTKVAGHLVFESFIEPSEQELATAFAFFKQHNVQDLILDLRYNSGGYVYIAQQLASYIGGNSLSGKTFAMQEYNDKWQSENSSFPFLSLVNSLNINRLVAITTRLTASASEAVMNGLEPHIDVVSVGDTTDGKPMGMDGWICGNKYIFCPITFKLVNSLGEGEYYDGIAPEKKAVDDITRDFSDKDEASLSEAIHYLKTGAFSEKGSGSFRKLPQFSERPSWTNNMFDLDKQINPPIK